MAGEVKQPNTLTPEEKYGYLEKVNIPDAHNAPDLEVVEVTTETGHTIALRPSPKGSVQVKRYAKAYTVEALATLVELMRASEDENIRIRAALNILAYGHGRPAAADFSGDDDEGKPLQQLPTAQLMMLINNMNVTPQTNTNDEENVVDV